MVADVTRTETGYFGAIRCVARPGRVSFSDNDGPTQGLRSEMWLGSVKRGGHVIVSTFGPEGPRDVAASKVMRDDAHSLHDQFGARFNLIGSSKELPPDSHSDTNAAVSLLLLQSRMKPEPASRKVRPERAAPIRQ